MARPSYCYVLVWPAPWPFLDLVKIGNSNNPKVRRATLEKQLRQYAPDAHLELRGITSGGEADELELKRRFAGYRTRLDWLLGYDYCAVGGAATEWFSGRPVEEFVADLVPPSEIPRPLAKRPRKKMAWPALPTPDQVVQRELGRTKARAI